MKTLFKINIFTYLLLFLSFLSGYYKEIIIIYFILIIHELGHYFFMRYYKIDVYSIVLYPYGGEIKNNMLINTNSKKVLIISLGGIFMQIIMIILLCFLYRLNLINYELYHLFIKYNTYILLFNILPIYPLDGFRIINSIIELFVSFRYGMFISVVLNIFFIILFIIYLYYYRINNYMIIIYLVISLINYIINIKYLLNKFYIERVIYELKYNGIISVRSKKSMFKNKYNYINGISEDKYLNIV